MVAANEKESQGHQEPTPKSKEAKKLDLFSLKVYSTGELQLQIANQQVVLSHYNFNSWNTLSKFKELLPSDSWSNFGAILKEDKVITKTSLQAALDSVTCMMSTAIAMQRSSWLQVSGLPHKIQQTIQDLPFSGSSLFLKLRD